MACLPFICSLKVKRGFMPIGVNILLVSVLLFRLISLGCAVYALAIINTDTALQTVHTDFVDTLNVFGIIPLGRMLVVIVYSCACAMMPIQVFNSVMGLAGVCFTSRAIVYLHICMSFITIPAMIVYGVLLAGGLHDFYYGIDHKFRDEVIAGSYASDIKTKLSCCGFSGEDPCMNINFGRKIPGCWDLWASPFHTFLSTMLAFVISMLILEVLNLVITDYEYRKWRLKEEPERSGNTGVLPYIPRDAFGDICVKIVLFWRKGALQFFMRCLGVCQGCIGIALIVYGAYNINGYPSFVSASQIARLRFHTIYFDDLIRILSTLLVVCGGISFLTSLQSVSITCLTSRAACYVSALINMLGAVVSVTVIIFWAVFHSKVIYGMEAEVTTLFSTALRYDPYLHFAQDLVHSLQCCGIINQEDFNLLIDRQFFFWNRITPSCSSFRACVPVLLDHFRTFSGVGLGLVSFLLLTQMLSPIYANKTLKDLSTGSGSEPGSEPAGSPAEHAEHTTEPRASSPAADRKGVCGNLRSRITQLWAADKTNAVGITLKLATLICGLSLIVTGLLLKFDDVFYDVNLYELFYPIDVSNRRFTYYLEALANGMLGLGGSEMIITFYGLFIYSWDSKFLEYILVVLRGCFCTALLAIIVLCIISKCGIDWAMYNQLMIEFQKYHYYTGNGGFAWKLLYFKMECCGIGNYGDFSKVNMEHSRQIPIYCCKNVTEWQPDLDSGMEACTDSLSPGSFYEQGCNEALLDRFAGYLITFLCLLSFMVLFQVVDIVLSVRRIHMLKPGNTIDEEIGILVKSVTGKFSKKKEEASNVSETAGPSKPQSDPHNQMDMKEHKIPSSLYTDAEKGEQVLPNTTSLPTEPVTMTGSERRRRIILLFLVRGLAACQGCIGLILVVYGGSNINGYSSFVSKVQIARLRFHNIYLDDLIEILASLLVFSGVISLLTSLQGVSVTFVTSRVAYYVSALINILGAVVSVTVIVFWAVFCTKVMSDMDQEVTDIFSTALRSDPYFHHAVDLIQSLGCCGITIQQDYMNLIPAWSWDRLSQYCSNYRPCAPVLRDHFRTFSGVSLSFVSLLLILQILAIIYANKKIKELSNDSATENGQTDSVVNQEPADLTQNISVPAEKNEATISASELKQTISDPAEKKEPIQSTIEPKRNIVPNRKGVCGNFKERIIQLWTDDKANIVGIVLKGITLICGLSLIVTGQLLRFDEIFDDVNLHEILYPLGISNRHFTYYLVALANCMLGLGLTEMVLVFYGLLIYCWNSKFLEYILVVLRGCFCTTAIVIIVLCIISKCNINWAMHDQLFTTFLRYQDYDTDSGLPWKLLFFKMQCCGVGNYGDFSKVNMQYSRQIPIYCCKNVTEWQPDLDSGMEACTDSLSPGSFYEQGCTDALLDRFNGYMITLFCLLPFLVLFQVFDIVLCVRRIRMLKPGNTIDKEIGILVKSVMGKFGKNKVMDASQVVTSEPSQPQSDPFPQINQPKRNTILPSLEIDKGQQPPPNTTLQSERVAEGRVKDRSRRNDRKQRLGKSSIYPVEVHRPESADVDLKPEPITLQGKDSRKVQEKKDYKQTSGRRKTARSGRSGRASETQVTMETEANNATVLLGNNSELKPRTRNNDASFKDGEKGRYDRQYKNENVLPITTERSENNSQESSFQEASDKSHKTNDDVAKVTERGDNDKPSSGEKMRGMETGKREQNDESLPYTTDLDQSDRNNKESVKSHIPQKERVLLGDNDQEEKYPRNVPSSMSETISGTEKEAEVSDKSGEFGETAVSGTSENSVEKSVKVESADKDTENKGDLMISDGPPERIISETVEGSTGRVVNSETINESSEKEISETEDGRPEKIISETVDESSEKHNSGTVDGSQKKVASSETENRSHEKVILETVDGNLEKAANSEAGDESPEKADISATPEKQTEDEGSPGTSEIHTENTSETDDKMSKEKEENEKLDTSDKKDNDSRYEYDDDFTDEEEENTIDFYKMIAGN